MMIDDKGNSYYITFQFKAKREMGLDGSDNSLRAMILARQQSRGQQVRILTKL